MKMKLLNTGMRGELEAQKLRDFTGLTIDWTKWENRTERDFDG